MILLRSDCLLIQHMGGEILPWSVDEIRIELVEEGQTFLDQELVHHAAAAVFHYYKNELGRTAVLLREFASSLEHVLRGFGLPIRSMKVEGKGLPVVRSDLRRLACESGRGFELVFFPRLRQEIRRNLSESPRLVRFQGLRGCVKQLTGARRWTHRCQRLNDQIVDYLRLCWSSEVGAVHSALVVE